MRIVDEKYRFRREHAQGNWRKFFGKTVGVAHRQPPNGSVVYLVLVGIDHLNGTTFH